MISDDQIRQYIKSVGGDPQKIVAGMREYGLDPSRVGAAMGMNGQQVGEWLVKNGMGGGNSAGQIGADMQHKQELLKMKQAGASDMDMMAAQHKHAMGAAQAAGASPEHLQKMAAEQQARVAQMQQGMAGTPGQGGVLGQPPQSASHVMPQDAQFSAQRLADIQAKQAQHQSLAQIDAARAKEMAAQGNAWEQPKPMPQPAAQPAMKPMQPMGAPTGKRPGFKMPSNSNFGSAPKPGGMIGGQMNKGFGGGW